MGYGGFLTGNPFGRSGRWGTHDQYRGLPFQEVIAFGGSTTEDVAINNIFYRQHTFTNVGSNTFSIQSLGTSDNTIFEIELLGAGGGGGTGNGQWAYGGGGGGYLKVTKNFSVGDHTVVVGSNGVQQTSCNNATWSTGGKGGDSSIDTIIAGGGYGGSSANSANASTSIGGTNTTTGALSVISNYSGGNGGKSGGDYNGFGGNNGLYSGEQNNAFGTGAAGVPNFTPGVFATGYGNGGSGGPSCQNGHRGGGRGSQGIVIIRYPLQEIR